jgi:DNA-binding beta-propeller fold protein YncE
LGEGILPSRDGFESVWEDKDFQAVRAKLEAKLPRLDYAPNAFVIEDTRLVPEGIAYDAYTQSFFMGSIAERKILRIGEGNAVSEFAGAAAGLDSILGLVVDSPRRTLYAVSTSALTTEGEAHRRNAVVAFDVDTGRMLRRIAVPAARQLNDVAVAHGGRVFATDSGSGAVYEVPKEGDAREVVPPGALPGSNGLAASPDSKRLYVAHSTGIAVVDLDTGTFKQVGIPERETVAAIDGLYEWQGQLIGVQNVTTPGRVILMTLSRDGASITKVQTLLSHHHNVLDEPTTGVVTPKGFFLLAATGVTHYNRAGTLDNPETLPKPTVVRIPLPR